MNWITPRAWGRFRPNDRCGGFAGGTFITGAVADDVAAHPRQPQRDRQSGQLCAERSRWKMRLNFVICMR
jgi:hypothetical protein